VTDVRQAGRPTVGGEFGIVLVGGGLQSGLLALGVLARNSGVRLAVVEAADKLGGNHTWCLNPTDVPPSAMRWLAPLIAHEWPGYDVRFPRFTRTLGAPYAAITSERFAHVVSAAVAIAPGSACFLGRLATLIEPHAVSLDDGTRLSAELVIDARGPSSEGPQRQSGFQKFVGLELEFDRDHRVERPVMMDATVPQRDGFRFFYLLPFGPRRLLVEDTYFSKSPVLDAPAVRREVIAYAEQFGLATAIVREEAGVLPMPWKSTPEPPAASPLAGGYRGGWFHPATGYSLVAATRLASYVAGRTPASVFGPGLDRLYRTHRSQVRYAELLNMMLFNCFEPDDMRSAFERFFTLPAGLIQRFFALSMTWTDRARIVAGLPPRGFSISAALAMARSP